MILFPNLLTSHPPQDISYKYSDKKTHLKDNIKDKKQRLIAKDYHSYIDYFIYRNVTS